MLRRLIGKAKVLTMVNLSLGAVKRLGAGEIWRQRGGNNDGDCGVEVWPSTRDAITDRHTCPFDADNTDTHLLLCLPLT